MTNRIAAGRLHAGHIGLTLRGIDVKGREVHAELRQGSHTSSETFINTNPLNFDTLRDGCGAMDEWLLDANEQVTLDGHPDLDLDADPATRWTLYWMTGDRQVVEGPDIATAMNCAGYGAGALAALDFYERGDGDHGYRWSDADRDWVRKDDPDLFG